MKINNPSFDWWHGPAWAACVGLAVCSSYFFAAELRDHHWINATLWFVACIGWGFWVSSAAARYDRLYRTRSFNSVEDAMAWLDAEMARKKDSE